MKQRVTNIKRNFQYLVGLAALVLVVLGVWAYFSNNLGSGTFAAIAFVVTAVIILAALFDWLAIRVALTFAVLSALLLGGVLYSTRPKADTGAYQAVFLTNGQVYFGHLSNPGGHNPVLRDIYYLQSQPSNPQNTSSSQNQQSQLSLVKLGNELHGPQDKMVIKSDQILFWENLKDSSKVVQAIHQYQNQNK